MKRLLIVAIFILTSVMSNWNTPVPNFEDIVLESKAMIHAGDEWELSVTVDNYRVGDTIAVTLLNGLKAFHKTLVLGTGGVAVWAVEEGEIIQAGESLIIVQYGDEIVEKSLIVLANEPIDGVLFTTANSIAAYGEGSATIMFLTEDEWGNFPTISEPFELSINYPDGNAPTEETLTYRDGLGRFELLSRGQAGRVRLSVDQEHLQSNLELMQTAGDAQSITLDILPTCVLNDGRDLFTLTANIIDQNNYPVTNGTLVKFVWEDGLAYARTIDGTATLRLPAPQGLGFSIYNAVVGNTRSNNATIEVTGDSC